MCSVPWNGFRTISCSQGAGNCLILLMGDVLLITLTGAS